MLAIFFALISYLGWGAGDIFGVIVTRKIGSYSATFWSLLIAFLLFSLYIPFDLSSTKGLNLNIILVTVILSLFLIAGSLFLYESFRSASAPLVGTIAATFPFITVLLSVFFLEERITANQIATIMVIFIGLITLSLPINKLKQIKLVVSNGVLFALMATVSWGIYFTFIKIPVKEVGWFWPNYISFTLFPLFYFFMKLRKINLVKPKNIWSLLIVQVLLLEGAVFSFNYAVDQGLTSIVAPIAGSYPTLFVVLAFLFFKDPITRQQIVGIIITLIGIVLLSIFSV